MKRMRSILCLLLALLCLIGCSNGAVTENPTTAPDSSGAALDTQPIVVQTAQRTEAALAQIKTLGESPDDNYLTFYEVFVYSFCDSNGDGIGDIPGLISKLDYLEGLGIQGIWLMPIHPSQSYHKYDVRDYYAIDPAYGTLEDFDKLIEECEKRNINVIIDLVLNHTGDDNTMFLEAVNYLKTLPAGAEPNAADCKYVDYYFFSREGGSSWHRMKCLRTVMWSR